MKVSIKNWGLFKIVCYSDKYWLGIKGWWWWNAKQYYGNSYLTEYGTDDYGGTLTVLTNNSDEYMFQMSKAAKNRKAGDLILDTNIYGKSKIVQSPSQIVHICIKYT